MRKIIVDLNTIKDDQYSKMYEIFGLDVQHKSYEDFERRLLQMSIETIIEVKNREQNLKSCSKWIFVLEDIQQKSDCMYCIWGEYWYYIYTIKARDLKNFGALMMPSPPWALFKKTMQGQGSSKRDTSVSFCKRQIEPILKDPI